MIAAASQLEEDWKGRDRPERRARVAHRGSCLTFGRASAERRGAGNRMTRCQNESRKIVMVRGSGTLVIFAALRSIAEIDLGRDGHENGDDEQTCDPGRCKNGHSGPPVFMSLA